MRILRYEDTPNPNALKCILDATVARAPASFRTPEDARDHPLAAEIFRIPGITNVFLLNDWLTINRTPGATWTPIKRALERALRDAPDADQADR
ncbi:MAG: NifU N-terminal domain-containing protein [Phycisphaerales bacterium]